MPTYRNAKAVCVNNVVLVNSVKGKPGVMNQEDLEEIPIGP